MLTSRLSSLVHVREDHKLRKQVDLLILAEEECGRNCDEKSADAAAADQAQRSWKERDEKEKRELAEAVVVAVRAYGRKVRASDMMEVVGHPKTGLQDTVRLAAAALDVLAELFESADPQESLAATCNIARIILELGSACAAFYSPYLALEPEGGLCTASSPHPWKASSNPVLTISQRTTFLAQHFRMVYTAVYNCDVLGKLHTLLAKAEPLAEIDNCVSHYLELLLHTLQSTTVFPQAEKYCRSLAKYMDIAPRSLDRSLVLAEQSSTPRTRHMLFLSVLVCATLAHEDRELVVQTVDVESVLHSVSRIVVDCHDEDRVNLLDSLTRLTWNVLCQSEFSSAEAQRVFTGLRSTCRSLLSTSGLSELERSLSSSSRRMICPLRVDRCDGDVAQFLRLSQCRGKDLCSDVARDDDVLLLDLAETLTMPSN